MLNCGNYFTNLFDAELSKLQNLREWATITIHPNENLLKEKALLFKEYELPFHLSSREIELANESSLYSPSTSNSNLSSVIRKRNYKTKGILHMGIFSSMPI